MTNWRSYCGIVAILSALILAPAVAAADPVSLSEAGERLPPIVVDSGSVTLEFEIALNGDRPTASYVTARTGDGDALQRTNLGYWVPWDGQLGSLIDNHAQVAAGVMKVKAFKDEDLSGELFPIRLTISYETASAFKFGVVELVHPGTH
ncbi:hypothetical protein NUH88_14605 [Nisaea acidiphila]|uniref:Copper resistance protein CopC n=1 Tax=Nisaea acidiphila TaxID=1862145 RepID=A0A9J7AQK2_9PROT|nr:hypothetical protein [Nisaea acidiphila]UUX48636.1 hypothetical protein NUH88_14605 [Nisaea acidiphila]